jgi:hypothetical protein
MSVCRAGRRMGAPLVAAMLLALPACSMESTGSRADSPSATAAAPLPGHAGEALPTPPPAPADDAASDQAALAVGVAAVTAFARPELPAEQWWSELRPLLSPAALEAYVGTDPAEVPAHAVTGSPWRGDSASSYLAMTFVPTDAGDYAVLLVRDGGGAPWLVERITLVPADATATPTSATAQRSGTGDLES